MTAATGILSAPLAALRDIHAGTAAFQAWVGAADAATAAAKFYLDETVRGPAGAFAIAVHGDLIRDRFSLGRASFQHRDGSSLAVYYRAPVVDDDDETAWITFSNALGAIWYEVELAAGRYDVRSLSVKSIEMADSPLRIVHEKRPRAGDYFEAALRFYYSRQP